MFKLPRLSILLCILRRLLLTRSVGINIEINCSHGNLDLLLLFLCNLGSIHGHFIRFAARCLSVLFSYIKRNKAGDCVQSQLKISPASKNSAPIHHESAKSFRPGQSLITSSCHGYCDVFNVGNFFESF